MKVKSEEETVGPPVFPIEKGVDKNKHGVEKDNTKVCKPETGAKRGKVVDDRP